MFDRVSRCGGPIWVIAAVSLLASPAIALTATETILHNFPVHNSTTPLAAFGPLKLDSNGALWGIAGLGGANGCGALYRLSPNGKIDIIYSIPAGPNNLNAYGGSEPLTKRFRVFDGAMPGAGAFGFGSLFTTTDQGVGSTLYSFNYQANDAEPSGHLTYGADNSIIGTADQEGNGGVLWQFSAAGEYTVLHSFTGGATDGSDPESGVVRDSAGTLYGTSRTGGPPTGTSYRGGVAWKLVGTTLTTLHDFTGGGLTGDTDGGTPNGLHLTHSGALYGTTYFGGIYGDGTIFEIAPDGTYAVLYNFVGNSCANPTDRLVSDSSGNLYGVSLKYTSRSSKRIGCVFQFQPNGKLRILMSFSENNPLNGYNPVGGLAIDATGNLYGTTNSGGTKGGGVIYKITP